MYYDALRTFISVVEEGNFTKAAEKRHISQPSVSLHIQNLELEFETTLFIRSPKKIKLTATGELLYERAKQILLIYETTKQEISGQISNMELKIGASFTIGEYILPDILEVLYKMHPEIHLEITIGNTGEIVEQVKLFHVDIGLIEGQCNEKSLEVTPFMKDELVLVARKAHPLSIGERSVEDLKEQIWVTREKGSGTRAILDHLLRTHGIKAKNIISISSTQGVKEAVIRGMGLSLLSYSAVMREIQNGELDVIHVEGETFKRRFSYVTSPVSSKRQAIDVLVNLLKKKAGE